MNRLTTLQRMLLVEETSAYTYVTLAQLPLLSYVKKMADHREEHFVPEEIPVEVLAVKTVWEALTDQEQKYCHWLTAACWAGSTICLDQTSPYSRTIFDMFQKLFHSHSLDELKEGVDELVWKRFLTYVVQFYGNMGNYLSFGDSKFLPRCTQEEFAKIVLKFPDPQVEALWESCGPHIFSLQENERELSLPPKGVSTYYSDNITQEDIDFVGEFLNEKKIDPENTRLWKLSDDVYELRYAAVKPIVGEESYKGKTIKFVSEFSEPLSKVVEYLEKALPYVANDNQKQMLLKYIDSFNNGSIEDHKDSQRWWIKDKGPVVETNIGFIETYRDPAGVRGEWEGWTAIVNKPMSEKFSVMVSNAEKLIELLPWPKEFEKDVFLRPDFTSLEVVSFGSSGIPAGINIPNYNDIRQNEGFKNVSLGNVLRAGKSGEKQPFLLEEDQVPFDVHGSEAFEVQVGIHELLGHGSGKLLSVDSEGNFNFDRNTINPLTNKPVESWYLPGQTWNSQFGGMGQTVEECRAECCGLFLCYNKDIFNIFGLDEETGREVAYINWLSMARKGLMAVEFYSPETEKWRQAHMQARFAILNVLREAGEGLVTLESDAEGNTAIRLDKSKIETVGMKAVGDFLRKLNVYKATADVKSMTEMYSAYCKVGPEYLTLREEVLSKKKPRRVFVQAHSEIVDDKVVLTEFEPTYEGYVQSILAHFPQH
eukprot:TRINITY_DN4010_c0_g1_i1.p1 TRINITY_DN4010_c0_g1~~TRINITY_DN4010_c0_g1_i1.p1  ORF type:complete len:708 (+),score=177.58 TRINITY_DN4010_c0_g1_i1:42-2165(+)